KGFSTSAERAVQNYNWPGNLRELRNVVERAVILAGGAQLELDDLPAKMCQSFTSPDNQSAQIGAMVTLEELENEHISKVIERTATMEEAAQVLGIDPATLYRKRKKLSL